VNTAPAGGSHTGDGRFPLSRKGYDREAVDHFVRATQAQISQLLQQYDSLIAYNHELRQALDDAHAQANHADFSALGGRVQEMLQIAEEQASDITQAAIQEADRLSAQRQAETDELRQSAYAEMAEMRDAQRAELDALRDQIERDAAQLRERVTAETAQLLASARLHAEAVRTEAEEVATGMRKAANFESQEMLAGAERDIAAWRQEAADQRERVMAELKEAQESANQTIQDMLGKATALQRSAGEHLSSETEQAAKLRSEALAAAEQIKVEANGDAEKIIDRARRQAAIIDERARQELALRRRQMRDEQELLTRRKHAMLNQLASVSALAVETAENLPDVPEVYDPAFSETDAESGHGSPAAEIESDPTIDNPANEVDEQIEAGEADKGAARDEAGEETERAGPDDQSNDSSEEAADETPAEKPEFVRASKP
jgi:cell division septum initiation protein DivIVA